MLQSTSTKLKSLFRGTEFCTVRLVMLLVRFNWCPEFCSCIYCCRSQLFLYPEKLQLEKYRGGQSPLVQIAELREGNR